MSVADARCRYHLLGRGQHQVLAPAKPLPILLRPLTVSTVGDPQDMGRWDAEHGDGMGGPSTYRVGQCVKGGGAS
jgi:hypothetical protein